MFRTLAGVLLVILACLGAFLTFEGLMIHHGGLPIGVGLLTGSFFGLAVLQAQEKSELLLASIVVELQALNLQDEERQKATDEA
jgi:hypothetical protein